MTACQGAGLGAQPPYLRTKPAFLLHCMSPVLALHFLHCGAAKSDTLADIADMPPVRREAQLRGLMTHLCHSMPKFTVMHHAAMNVLAPKLEPPGFALWLRKSG
jgi:hypothetical protein